MIQSFVARNSVDQDGLPAGGKAVAVGIDVRFQDGPLGRGTEARGANGGFVETLLAIASQRIQFYQTVCGGKFQCRENAEAVVAIGRALDALADRTAKREERGVEGTHTA